MQKRFRIGIFCFVCATIIAAVRKRVVVSGTADFADSPSVTDTMVTAQMPDTLGTDEQQQPVKLPTQQEEWASYLVATSDPEMIYKKYLLATYLYTKHQSIAALPLAISYATQLGRYDDASALLKQLPDINTLQTTLEIPIFMKLLFNTSDLSFAQLKNLKSVIDKVYSQGAMDASEYNFYYFLITLIKGDMSNAQFYLNNFSTGSFAAVAGQLRTLEGATKQYGTTPEYYLRGMRAMYLYQQGRRGPARYIGQQIRQQDPNYLLAEQLIAYSSMALQDWKGAILSLQQLQKVDPGYADVYQFFQAIAHFSQKDYETSILLFDQIPTTSTYYPDVVRYLFLAYVQLGDYEKVEQLIDNILAEKKLLDADVYTIFDSLLYGQVDDVTRFVERLQQLERRCQTELQNKAYICLYGKGGLLLATGEKEKAYKIVTRMVHRYPRPSLYKLLGDLATELGEKNAAEEWYRVGFLMQEEQVNGSLATHP